MFNKKISILILVFVSLIAVSAVSATENVTNDIGITNDVPIESDIDTPTSSLGSVEELKENVVNVENPTGNDNLYECVDEDNCSEILGENENDGSEGSLSELYALITTTSSGNTLYLTKNYTASEDFSIILNNPIVIDGCGHEINGNNHFFNINSESDNITLKNIIFKNFSNLNRDNEHIYVSILGLAGKNSIIDNCSFIGNNLNGVSDIIFCWNNLEITNCNFINNSGSCICFSSYDLSIINCSFINHFGDLLYAYGGFTKIANCCFINTVGTTIFSEYGPSNEIEDCIFINNSAKTNYHIIMKSGKISNSKFNTIADLIDISLLTLENVTFYGSEKNSINFVKSFDNETLNVLFYDDKGNPLNNKKVIFTINNENYTRYTENNGLLRFNENLGIGDYNVTIFNPYTNESVITSLSIKKHNIICDDLVIGFNETGYYYIRIVDDNGQPISGATVNLKIKEDNFKIITNSSGYASFGVPIYDIGIGTIPIEVMYNEDIVSRTLTFNPINVVLKFSDMNITLGNAVTLVTYVLPEYGDDVGGFIRFFDGERIIGDSFLQNNVAILDYLPTNSGEHKLTAILGSYNYVHAISTSTLLVDSASIDVLVDNGTVGFESVFVANVKGLYSTINEGIVEFYIDNNLMGSVPVVNGSASVTYTPLVAKSYSVKAVFVNSSNFLDDENTFDYKVAQADSEIIISDLNGTVGHELTITANVVSSNNLTVNEGCIIFLDGSTQIGEVDVLNGVASLVYTPVTDGEHNITAVFTSDNYLSSSNSCKLLVDSASIEVFVDNGTVGFESVFVANVKGLYSTINIGFVQFFVDNTVIGTVPVVNGSASVTYTPLVAKDYSVIAVFVNSSNIFQDDENTTNYTVGPADSEIIMGDLNGTVGHELTITANVVSSNNLTINEGYFIFLDGSTRIGEVDVLNGVASLVYTPVTDGEHNITAIFTSANYLSSSNSCKLLVDSATIEVLVDNGTVGFESVFVANVKGLYSTINEGIVEFYIDNNLMGSVPVVDGSAKITYIPLIAKDYGVKAVFTNCSNFLDDENTVTYTVNKADSEIIMYDLNGTVGHELTITVNVVSSNNLTINEGYIIFLDGETNIGKSDVQNGVASLVYTPVTDGEHNITAIFTSDNYLSSNNSCKLLVDSASIDVLVNSGIVGFESVFVANVKGLYSTINEGIVEFYIDNNLMGSVPVVDGSAKITYIPLIAKNYSVKAIFTNSSNFLDDEITSDYKVAQADSEIIMYDLNGTVGHELTITVNVVSSNNLTINEGYFIFLDGSTQIADADVHNGVATLSYTPTTAGEHPITAFYYSSNYEDTINSALINVSKADVILSIENIVPVYFTNPSNIIVNVTSNSKAVQEGKVKFYVDDVLIRTASVYDGIANINYVANFTGNFTLKAVYEETGNYLTNEEYVSFEVNKMPTSLTGETTFFDEEESKTFTTALTDDNSNGVGGQLVRIEAIKYSGESKTFTGISDANGITIYDVNALTGGMWIIRGIYDGNGNYIQSSFTDRFVVIRMNTTTTIEEISNPRVNHTYKLKANIHDEDGKLVKEGIVQFYLDGVDIGSIDLSKNNGHQNALGDDLLGASYSPSGNSILAWEEDDFLYIEYTPTEAGNHTLSVVYEGTSLYKSSNQTTAFNVVDGPQPIDEKDIDVPELSSSSSGSVAVRLPADATGTVTLSIAGKEYKFDVLNGIANVEVPELTNGNYPYTITYSGDSNYSSFNKTGSLTVNKPSQQTTPTKPVTKTTLTLKKVTVKRSAKKLTIQATLKVNGKAPKKGTKITFKFKGKKYIGKTNAKGVAKITVKKSVLKKLKKGKKVTYTATYGKITKKVKVKVKK